MSEPEVRSCYRHDHRAAVICQRCDKPICTECMHQASVGFHCPECLRSGGQQIIRGPVDFDPVATKILVGMNLVAYLVATVWGRSALRLAGTPFSKGALFGPLVEDGEWYRIFSSAFLHNGLVHLAFNMWILWILGSQVERVLRPARYVVLYVVALTGGSFGALLLDPTVPVVGASGAVFGVLGATAVIQRSAGLSIWSNGLGPLLGINLLLTFAVPQISIGGHVGGLLAGTAVAGLYLVAARLNKTGSWSVVVAGAVGILLFAACLWAAAQWMDPLF